MIAGYYYNTCTCANTETHGLVAIAGYYCNNYTRVNTDMHGLCCDCRLLLQQL